jgi:hypothetical protein
VYLSLLLTEISATARAYAGRPRKPLTSVYLGGGTPSLISAVNLHRLLARVDDAFGIDADAEITCEMDPATFDSAKAAAFRSAGVNRASVGAQSFDDDLLATCRRAHRRTDIYDAMTFLRRAGFDNVSVDLISGLPGQSLDAWSRTLACAIALEPEHISTYDLELDEGTRFSALYRAGVSPLPSDDAAADMLTMTAARLADAGYDHYEVSSYSKRPATQSRHNLSYWHSRGTANSQCQESARRVLGSLPTADVRFAGFLSSQSSTDSAWERRVSWRPPTVRNSMPRSVLTAREQWPPGPTMSAAWSGGRRTIPTSTRRRSFPASPLEHSTTELKIGSSTRCA